MGNEQNDRWSCSLQHQHSQYMHAQVMQRLLTQYQLLCILLIDNGNKQNAGLFALKKKNGGKFPQHAKADKPAPAEGKAPRFYPAEDVPKPLNHRAVRKPTKLRSSITPGTVLILLA